MPVSRHHPRSIYLIPVAYPPLSSSAPSSSSSKGKRARGVLPSPLTSTLLRHARKLALDPAAHEDEAKEEELRRPAVLLPCKPMGEREAASAQGASDWNSLMLKARKERGAMFDAATQAFQVDLLSPDFYAPPSIPSSTPSSLKEVKKEGKGSGSSSKAAGGGAKKSTQNQQQQQQSLPSTRTSERGAGGGAAVAAAQDSPRPRETRRSRRGE